MKLAEGLVFVTTISSETSKCRTLPSRVPCFPAPHLGFYREVRCGGDRPVPNAQAPWRTGHARKRCWFQPVLDQGQGNCLGHRISILSLEIGSRHDQARLVADACRPCDLHELSPTISSLPSPSCGLCNVEGRPPSRRPKSRHLLTFPHALNQAAPPSTLSSRVSAFHAHARLRYGPPFIGCCARNRIDASGLPWPNAPDPSPSLPDGSNGGSPHVRVRSRFPMSGAETRMDAFVCLVAICLSFTIFLCLSGCPLSPTDQRSGIRRPFRAPRFGPFSDCNRIDSTPLQLE